MAQTRNGPALADRPAPEVTLTTTTSSHPTGPVRLWTDEEVAYVSQVSWDLGRYHERERIATATAELDVCWRPVGRKAYEVRVAERIAEMEAHAARNYERLGYPAGYVYRGGPVDWETGRPVRRLEVAA